MLTKIQQERIGVIRKAAGGDLRPADIVADARSTDSPLHELFEWDDTLAAELYRLSQATRILHVVAKVGIPHERPTTHVQVRPNPMPAALPRIPPSQPIDPLQRLSIDLRAVLARYVGYSACGPLAREVQIAIGKYARSTDRNAAD